MKIAFVIPCYNEASRIELNEFRILLINKSITVFFVDDGSTDDTSNLLKTFCYDNPDRAFFLSLKKNSGKAEAVRSGMCHANSFSDFDYIGFFDADLATPINEILNLCEFVNSNDNFNIIYGSRVLQLGTKIKRSTKRHILGRVFASAASLVSNSNVYDSQCGLKLFRGHVIKELFDKKFVSKWFFDVEILIRYIKKYGDEEKAHEFVLKEWTEKGNSKLKFKDFLLVPLELYRIYSYYKKV